jgi:hypothetical protein
VLGTVFHRPLEIDPFMEADFIHVVHNSGWRRVGYGHQMPGMRNHLPLIAVNSRCLSESLFECFALQKLAFDILQDRREDKRIEFQFCLT